VTNDDRTQARSAAGRTTAKILALPRLLVVLLLGDGKAAVESRGRDG
jgi:hypothetical protein